MGVDFSRKPKGFNTHTKAREYEQLAKTLLARAEDVCRHLLPAGRREGHEWRVGSIHGERGQSLGVNLKTGVWKDFDGGEGGADLLNLWAEKKGIKAHEAFDEAAGWAGWDVPSKPKATVPSWAAPKKAAPALPAPASSKEDDSERLWWMRAKATKKWEYFTEDGELFVTVCRFERDGEKIIRPWDHRVSDWKWPEGQRPLFDLIDLKKTTGPVVLVEGEKCADRLKAMGYVVTTMPGGSNAASVIDWSPLKGRDVIRWADNDHPIPGKTVAREKWLETTLVCLSGVGAASVRDVAVPGQAKPDGWDCADATDAEITDAMGVARISQPVWTVGSPPATLPKTITRKDLELPPFANIPKRRFVYDHVYQRGTVTVTAGEGGSGKSAMHVIEALAIATGRDLLETGKPIEQCNVWMIALEDDETEMHRRIAAAMMHFSIDRKEIKGRLFVTTRADAQKFMLGATVQGGVAMNDQAFIDMRSEIVAGNIGVTMIDPYVYTHMVNENDNGGQAAIMGALSAMSQELDIAIGLVHHAKKLDANNKGGPSSADFRGASAIVNSSRHGRIVSTMTSHDAEQLGVEDEQRFFFFRTTSVKANYAPKAHAGRWFKLHGVRLPNGGQDEEGDGVGVVTKWTPPDPFEQVGATVNTLKAVQMEVERAFRLNEPYRVDPRAKLAPWIGEAIASAAGLDPDERSDKLKIAKLYKTWKKTKALIEEKWQDAGRQTRMIVRRGQIAE